MHYNMELDFSPKNNLMFDRLKKHHIGIIVEKKEIPGIEKIIGKQFHLDTIQGTRVLFIKDISNNFFIEYIVKEGRAKNLSIGYSHTCYEVEDYEKFLKIEKFIIKDKNGYSITKLEKSNSKECNLIKFYFVKNLGLIEINLLKK